MCLTFRHDQGNPICSFSWMIWNKFGNTILAKSSKMVCGLPFVVPVHCPGISGTGCMLYFPNRWLVFLSMLPKIIFAVPWACMQLEELDQINEASLNICYRFFWQIWLDKLMLVYLKNMELKSSLWCVPIQVCMVYRKMGSLL